MLTTGEAKYHKSITQEKNHALLEKAVMNYPNKAEALGLTVTNVKCYAHLAAAKINYLVCFTVLMYKPYTITGLLTLFRKIILYFCSSLAIIYIKPMYFAKSPKKQEFEKVGRHACLPMWHNAKIFTSLRSIKLLKKKLLQPDAFPGAGCVEGIHAAMSDNNWTTFIVLRERL